MCFEVRLDLGVLDVWGYLEGFSGLNVCAVSFEVYRFVCSVNFLF